ncbi:MAG: nitronate monooxygenase, partial [Candidatus Competibacter sp.]|nr:nitronate monooxygenase [Candidatus Competibacter sp.]
LACPESGAHPAYKALLREGCEIATTLSRAFTGRCGRVLRNRLSDGLRSHEAELPDFPLQLFLTQDLRQAAAERNRTDFMALWAGQGCHLCEERPAAELIATWVGQATALLGDGEAVEAVEVIESASAANDPDSADPNSADPDLADPVQ